MSDNDEIEQLKARVDALTAEHNAAMVTIRALESFLDAAYSGWRDDVAEGGVTYPSNDYAKDLPVLVHRRERQ